MRKGFLVLPLMLVGLLFAAIGGPDGFGHWYADSEEDGVTYDWIDTVGAVLDDESVGTIDDGSFTVELPFEVTFYGETYSECFVGTNGVVSFTETGASDYSNDSIPNTATPNLAIFVLWDDQRHDDHEGDSLPSSKLLTKTVGEEPERQFVIFWQDFYYYSGDRVDPITYQIIFYEGGAETKIKCQYKDVEEGNPDTDYGADATIGLEDATGEDGLLYSYLTASLSNEFAIEYTFGMFDHDVTISGIDFPDTISAGEENIPSVRVGNLGTFEETDLNVTLTMWDGDMVEIYSESATLASIADGAVADVEFPGLTIDPDGAYVGDYTMEAEVELAGDEMLGNNSLEGMFTLIGRDIELVVDSFPTSGFSGTTIEFTGMLYNNGITDETFTLYVEVTDTSYEIVHEDEMEFTIAAGEEEAFDLDDFTFTDAGPYEIIIEADVEEDQVPYNNYFETGMMILMDHISWGGPDDYGTMWYDSYYDDEYAYVPIDTTGELVPFEGTYLDDAGVKYILPFRFPFCGEVYDSIGISTNGWISFDDMEPTAYSNTDIPTADTYNNMICPLWDDLTMEGARLRIRHDEDAGALHIIWVDVKYLSDASSPLLFECILYDTGDIVFQYDNLVSTSYNSMGASATIGIEDATGTSGLKYMYEGEPSGNLISGDFAIHFTAGEPPADTVAPSITYLSDDELWLIWPEAMTFISAVVQDARSTVEVCELRVNIGGIWTTFMAETVEDNTYTFAVEGLEGGTTYDYYVYAEDAEGNATIEPSTYEMFTAFDVHDAGDEGGWQWADQYSAMEMAPTYEWIEIDPSLGGSGTVLTGLSDDWVSGPLPLGGEFLFPFYGENHWGVRMCTNGYITFDTEHSSPVLYPPEDGFPSMEAPALIVAAFMEDLYPEDDSKMIWWSDPAGMQAVYQWSNFYSYHGPEAVTFQIVLNFSGEHAEIHMNYMTADQMLSPGIGIQDRSMTVPTWQEPIEARLPMDEYTIKFWNVDERDVAESPKLLPESVSISSVTPNPFNPVCEVTLDMPESGVFEVFDVMGQKVWERSITEAGRHTLRFDGGDLPGGIYLGRVSTETGTDTKRMMLVK